MKRPNGVISDRNLLIWQGFSPARREKRRSAWAVRSGWLSEIRRHRGIRRKSVVFQDEVPASVRLILSRAGKAQWGIDIRAFCLWCGGTAAFAQAYVPLRLQALAAMAFDERGHAGRKAA
ncbi:hypothetical protein [Xaviernesmea oryzae]|uniref:hypothetical protein n=1 Tax=Xaviernesmea oryzae TaxID=464029 RepID=UPI001113BD77|nr:hypothetical protein [Xaviernesmea oryzae]